jgi:hypothetical protein
MGFSPGNSGGRLATQFRVFPRLGFQGLSRGFGMQTLSLNWFRHVVRLLLYLCLSVFICGSRVFIRARPILPALPRLGPPAREDSCAPGGSLSWLPLPDSA